jgi:hypothetical protein
MQAAEFDENSQLRDATTLTASATKVPRGSGIFGVGPRREAVEATAMGRLPFQHLTQMYGNRFASKRAGRHPDKLERRAHGL